MDAETGLLALAAKQYYVFTHEQAVRCGFTRGQIARRVERGQWRRLHRGVFTFAATPLGWEQQVMAAVLACGPDAVASHLSARAVWGVCDFVDHPHTTVSKRSSREHPGITVHRTAHPERRRYRAFPVTPPMRTLLDCARYLNSAQIARDVDRMHYLGWIRPDRLLDYLGLGRNAAAPNAGVLRDIVAARVGQRAMESEPETDLFEIVRTYGLPALTTQHWVTTRDGERKRIDFAFVEQRLAIEVDGYEFHSSKEAFENDHIRQTELEQLGWDFRRFTRDQVKQDPANVAITISRWTSPGAVADEGVAAVTTPHRNAEHPRCGRVVRGCARWARITLHRMAQDG